MRECTDEQLMKSYAGGNMEAFEALYARHRAPLYRYLLRLSGEPATANDLYQGSWEKVIKARNRYRDSAPFRAWLYRIAHNHAMDHFRRHRPTSDELPENLADVEADPADHATDESRTQELLNAIEDLPEEQKDTLLLRIKSELDLKTIADITGVNPETAKSRLRYAVKHLKKTLGDRNTPAG